MNKNISILIYEKEKDLNSILFQLFSDIAKYKTYTANEKKNALELVNIKKFDICILNIEDIQSKPESFIDILLCKNRHINIIGYSNNLTNNIITKYYKINFLHKPFRFNALLEKIDNIKKIKKEVNKITLMNHIEFSPNKKSLYNLNTQIILRLTEKENYLLHYLYNKRNLELTKNDLLTNIWGVTERINTHTLETHLYRLKQKLFKLEPNLSFSLINKNGLYSLKYN